MRSAGSGGRAGPGVPGLGYPCCGQGGGRAAPGSFYCCANSRVLAGRGLAGPFIRLRSVCRVVIRSQERDNSELDFIPINSRFKCVQGTDSCGGLSRGSQNPLPFVGFP